MARAALAFLTLAVSGALLALASGAAAVRIESPSAPPRALQVPAWFDLGGAPPADEREYVCAGWADDVWRVRVVDGVLQVRPDEVGARDDDWPYELDFAHALDPALPLPGISTSVRERWATEYAREHARRWVAPVIDGWLIGFDGGEYGGSLWWYPKVPAPGVKLAAENVHAIVILPGRAGAVVFVGLSHMGTDHGQVRRVGRRDSDRRWSVEDRHALRGAPGPILELPEGILVATTMSVELVSLQGVPTLLNDVSPLRFMSPVSLAVGPAGEIAVGMQHLLVVFRPNASGYAPRWYAPVPCAVFVEDTR
jgi:hypothetical protein